MTRADLHRLVDDLPAESVEAAALWLERLRDLFIARLETATPDDEPLTEEERQAVERLALDSTAAKESRWSS